MKELEYNPDFFQPTDIDHAKHIILTPEDSSVNNRWDLETKWSMDTIDLFMEVNERSVVLDWGCGIGRLSKQLIDRYGCKVVGVDIQPAMLDLAVDYVGSDLFTPLQYQDAIVNLQRYQFTHVISSWVFQHSTQLQYEIPLIYQSMDYKAQMFVVELDKKAIPNTAGGFYNDGVSSKIALEKFFDFDVGGFIPRKYTTKKIREMSWWAVLTKRDKPRT